MFSEFINRLSKSAGSLDPDRIYVENIRSILNTNTRFAKIICEIAVQQGYFEKYIAVECKNESCQRIIASFSSKKDIPDEISCYLCEDEGENQYKFKKNELNLITYFKYVEDSIKELDYIK